jgi:hypothetical protein
MPGEGDEKAAAPIYTALDQAVFAGLQDGEGVIVDTRSAFYFGLNKTAAFLWDKLQKEKDVTALQLTDALCARFEVSREDASRDVEEFLRHVVEYGLARRCEISLNK